MTGLHNPAFHISNWAPTESSMVKRHQEPLV